MRNWKHRAHRLELLYNINTGEVAKFSKKLYSSKWDGVTYDWFYIINNFPHKNDELYNKIRNEATKLIKKIEKNEKDDSDLFFSSVFLPMTSRRKEVLNKQRMRRQLIPAPSRHIPKQTIKHWKKHGKPRKKRSITKVEKLTKSELIVKEHFVGLGYNVKRLPLRLAEPFQIKIPFAKNKLRQVGTPDFLMWRNGKHSAFLVEVKTPETGLSLSQLEWLKKTQYPVKICYVDDIDEIHVFNINYEGSWGVKNEKNLHNA